MFFKKGHFISPSVCVCSCVGRGVWRCLGFGAVQRDYSRSLVVCLTRTNCTYINTHNNASLFLATVLSPGSISSVLRGLMIRKMTSSLSSSDFPELWTLLLLLGPLLLLQGLCEEKKTSQKPLIKKKERVPPTVGGTLCAQWSVIF